MKKILVITIFGLMSLCSVAQFSGFSLKTENQELIERAMDKCFSIIEQCYQLEDTITHQRFGRYGNEDFGKNRTLAVNIGNDYVFDVSVLVPWLSDDNYVRYKDSHKPVLSRSFIMEFNDSIKKSIELIPDTVSNGFDGFISVTDTVSKVNGLKPVRYAEPKDGWVIWVSCDSTIKDYDLSQNVDLVIYKKNIEFSQDSLSYKIDKPNTDQNIWGGIVIVPEQTAIGQLTFNLGGIINYNSIKDEWRLIPFSGDTENVKVSEHVNELTPLDVTIEEKGNKKKNKKKPKKNE